MNTEKKSSGWKWFWGILISFVIVSIIFTGIAFIFFAKTISHSDKRFKYETYGSGKGKIAVVDLNFTIYTAEPIIRQFKKYREDNSIKAIILRVDSPGGGVAASQEMYDEIRRTRESGKPIIVSIGSLGASGSYMASCGGTIIVANPGSLVGSIGVIAQFITVKDLAEKLGIKETTVKSGKLKDSGDPFRYLNPDDIDYFQDIVNDSFDQFLDIVSKERKIDRDELLKIANGRVFTGRQALEHKLVDTLGTYEDAVKIACNIAKIEGEPVIVKERAVNNFIDIFLNSFSHSELNELKNEFKEEFLNKPILQYKFEK